MTTTKEYLEILYLISGPTLAVLAFLGLRQLTIAKEQLDAARDIAKTNSRRDALRLTAEQVSIYSREIIPVLSALEREIESKNVGWFAKSTVRITSDSIEATPCTDSEELEKMLEITLPFTTAMNALEAFAVFFVSGVADEVVAYHSLSSTYCNSVKQYLPFLISYKSNNNAFESTVTLFHIWHQRMEHEKIVKNIKELQSELGQSRTKHIRPVGV